MSPTFCLSVGSHLAAIAVGAVAGAAYLTVSSNSPLSLADYISAICAKSFGSAPAAEAPYLAENVSAMTKMMIDMGIRPSGDVDTDFVAMMVPHHEGAIEMAQTELRYGRNESLRRMAQEIVVTQLQEITAMRLALGQPLPPSVPSPFQTRDAATNSSKYGSATVIATSPIGQAPQALVYVPDAVPAASGAINSAMTRMMVVPEGHGTSNLQPLGLAGQSAQLWLAPPGAKKEERAPTSVSLSDQGLVQVLEAAVTGLAPGKPYLLALATEPSGTGALEPLQGFMTNPAGAAVVNAIGPIRQLVRGEDKIPRRYLVILPGTPGNHGAAVQVQRE